MCQLILTISYTPIAFTFHYASTLSHPFFVFPQRSFVIYIPLCFYFILSSPFSGFFLENLHSTMLLLYLFTYIFRQCLSAFTFHYASTLSAGNALDSVKDFLFTFHYASTLSDIYFQRYYASLNLHSTMLLLYPSDFICLQQTGKIYIPLCFYFIGKTVAWRVGRRIIYIPLCFYFILPHQEYKLDRLYLHSTMLLLYFTTSRI